MTDPQRFYKPDKLAIKKSITILEENFSYFKDVLSKIHEKWDEPGLY